MSVLELTSDQYHADEQGEPSLSSTIARLLLSRTPAHAKAQHPRLSKVVRRDSAAMDMGTAVHQILLRDDRIDVIPYVDFRSKAAQEARDESRANGRVPMLREKWGQANEIASEIKQRVAGLRPVPFTNGSPEVTIVWNEAGANCRARLDWLTSDHAIVWDLKTTSRSAAPRDVEKQIFSLGYDVQADFYKRAVRAAFGVTPIYEWIVAETEPPYGVTRHRLSDEAAFQASVKVDTAIAVWKDCLASGIWPGYDDGLNIVHPPAWMRASTDAWADLDVDMESVPF